MNILIDVNALFHYFGRGICFSIIHTGVDCFRILCCHIPEKNFYDNRRIVTDTKPQKKYVLTDVKIIITFGCLVPAFVLNKAAITSQVHCHRLSALEAFWNKSSRNLHIFLLLIHCSDCFLITIGFLMARFAALPKAVISPCIKKS